MSVLANFYATPLGELLTGSAYDAHPTDVTAPLSRRFAGQTILALHVALEKAATVRVTFDPSGTPSLSGIRNIRNRSSAELADALRAEAATGLHWVVIVFATGWQAVIGQRAARPDANERPGTYARHRLLFDTPEVVVPRAQMDRIYTAIDHPMLDKSIVFSLRRRDVDELVGDIRRSGCEVASVRVAVAAQLEAWLAREGEAGLTRDLLVTDGLSALLLNTAHGDVVPPPGAVELDQPRQATQRPSAIEDDLTRFVKSNAGRELVFLGPDDLCAAVKRQAPEAAILRPPNHPAHNTQSVALEDAITHDFNPDAREVRPALPRRWRRLVWGYMAALAALLVLSATNLGFAVRQGYAAYHLEREATAAIAAAERDAAIEDSAHAEFAKAGALRDWVAGNFHAQRFCYRLLREVPTTAALDNLTVDMNDGQIALSFIVLGDADTQLSAHRAIERAVTDLRFKIGGEDPPTAAASGPRAVQYRMHLIVPDAGEVTSS